jgi:Putative auto-transporter adhesin, head GIN domain
MRHSALALALPLALLTASPALAGPSSWFSSQEKGNGQLKTEERRLPAFEKVELRTSLDVNITEGAAASTRVTVDGNLQPLLKTKVEGGTLIIETEGRGIDESRGSKVDLVMPKLSSVQIRGSGDVRVERTSAADALELGVQGSGDLRYRGSARTVRVAVQGSGDVLLAGGRTERLEVEIRGSGNVAARELPTRDASVTIQGSGDTELTATGGDLTFDIRGSGDVAWWGEGQVKGKVVRGSGEVVHR